MWFFSSFGGILELRRGSQPSPWVGPGIVGKGLIFRRRWNHVFFLELRRDCRVTTGNSRFLFNWPREVQFSFELRVRTGDCSRDTAGPNSPHPGLCPGPNVPLLGRQLSRHCILDSPGVKCPHPWLTTHRMPGIGCPTIKPFHPPNHSLFTE